MSSIDTNPVTWDLDLSPLLDRPVAIETMDGTVRRTVIHRVDWREVRFGSVTCPIPERLVLDDEHDFIVVRNVAAIALIEAAEPA